MCSKLFDGALRPAVYPGDWGSSATVDRNWSNFSLKKDRSTSFKFLSALGRELNNLAPFTQKLGSFSYLISAKAVVIRLGIIQNLPCLVEILDLIPSPTLGTMFCRIFQAYRILYLSCLLCKEYNLSKLSLSK